MRKKVPTCSSSNCTRKGKDLYVYTDGSLTIGICYVCGAFDGIGTPSETLEDFIYDPELILDLIKSGHLIAIN